MASKFILQISAATGAAYVLYLRRNLLRAHAILKPALNEMSLALVGDARMSKLHVQFMGIEGPTDVLTFPLDEDARGRVTSGEVVVCVPEARRRAKDHKERPERELLLYALHGMLHLSGYDDRTPADFRRMHRTEDKILTQLGIGPVFDRGTPTTLPKPSSREATLRASSTRGTATGRRTTRRVAAKGARL